MNQTFSVMKTKALHPLSSGLKTFMEKSLPAIALSVGLSFVTTSVHAVDWALSVDAVQVETDVTGFNDDTGFRVGGAIKLVPQIWLNLEYANSGTLDNRMGGSNSYAEIETQELRLFMEAQRLFNPRYGIYFATGFSRFETDLNAITNNVVSTTESSGFTVGAKVGLQFNFEEAVSARLGYEFVSDVADNGGSVQLDGYSLGLRFEF